MSRVDPTLRIVILKSKESGNVNPTEINMPGLLSRLASWEILQAVSAGAYVDVATERAFRKYSLESFDRALVKEISYGAIRQRKFLDCWIDYLGKVPAKSQPPLLRWLLHLGLYQIFRMDRIPLSAAVNTSVELAKKGKLFRLAPVVNGILRSAIRAKESGEELPLPEPYSSSAFLAQVHSLPIWLAEQLVIWRGAHGAEQIAIASNQSPPIEIRVNCIRARPEQLKKDFGLEGLEAIQINGLQDALKIIGGGDIREWPGYKEGKWCVQDRSSQRASLLLAPRPGERVLDACSAPGGKTTHLAELMNDKGELWAVDRSVDRLRLVSTNAQRLGLKCINILKADSTSLLDKKPNWRGYFDRILVDAPCSGLGTLARNPDARWRINPKLIDEIVDLQKDLLGSLLPLLRTGGRIVYSTCTIHPKENVEQIKDFLNSHDQLHLKEEKQYWPQPGEYRDGFYIAVMDLMN